MTCSRQSTPTHGHNTNAKLHQNILVVVVTQRTHPGTQNDTDKRETHKHTSHKHTPSDTWTYIQTTPGEHRDTKCHWQPQQHTHTPHTWSPAMPWASGTRNNSFDTQSTGNAPHGITKSCTQVPHTCTQDPPTHSKHIHSSLAPIMDIHRSSRGCTAQPPGIEKGMEASGPWAHPPW